LKWYLPVLVVCVPLAVYLLLAASAPDVRDVPVHETATPVSEATPPNPDPIAFLKMCIDRYNREVRGYNCTMEKRERIVGRLYAKEVIEIALREHPFSVSMHWLEGARKADKALYVEGENGGKMLARPHGALARAIAGNVVERDVEGPDARQSGRYTLKQFGIKKGTERTLAAWEAARKAGTLHVEYLGVHKVQETGNRPCYKLHRTSGPEADGVIDSTFYIDVDYWLQVGSVLKGDGEKLIGEYFFRDIHLNPTFSKDQFTPAALLSP
jgi:hypothetical protein